MSNLYHNPECCLVNRKTEYPVNNIFPERWSPRAMSGEEIDREELMSLFEAARWAPSAYNNQPRRFIYAKNGTPEWDKMFSLLVEFNQLWVKKASFLVLVLSQNIFEHNEMSNLTHSFDVGAAWMNIVLQGSINGLIVHGMSGLNYEKARTFFNISKEYNIEMMFAVGKPGKIEDLPPEMQERELPSDRKKIEEFVFEGEFKK